MNWKGKLEPVNFQGRMRETINILRGTIGGQPCAIEVTLKDPNAAVGAAYSG